ncbi:MAG TPA: SufS family cysteine desulfurase [Solirubrobacterales bacterium]|nr:SufS family cysteine desulfurase [Solirubrobacterales bacterium]
MGALTDKLDLTALRAQFPVLGREINGQPLAYLDSGASAQKPEAVLRALDEYNRFGHANVHRGAHTLAAEATEAYEGARARIATHLGDGAGGAGGSGGAGEVIFTANFTDAANLVAQAWGRANLGPGDRILLTEMEHHSNLVPWHMVAEATGAELDWVGIDETGRLSEEDLAAGLAREPKLVTVTHISNVLGTINPIAEITRRAHEAGALVFVDGAQAAPKMALDMGELGVDFYAFTGHKLYGPTGVGVLWGRRELLAAMGPYRGGGSMIRKVSRERITWADPPARFEAGTPPIAEAVGLGAAVEWLEGAGIEAIAAHEKELTAYALGRLGEVPGLRLFGPAEAEGRAGILSFEIEGIHPHDVAEILNRHGVAVRAGHHCAQVLMQRLGVTATTRASLAAYNTSAEIDRLIEGLADARRIFAL